MAEGRSEECCLENKQSIAASSSSFSAGSGNGILRSPGIYSPATTSPSQKRTTGPIRRAKGGWTPQEDETLKNAVEVYKGKSWKKIAEFFHDRSEVQCLHRWQKVLNPDLVKGPWTQEEDDKITTLVAKYGPTKWSVIAKSLPGRIGKQCRERWHNHLNPCIKKDAWTSDEELVLMDAHRIYGNKWAEIAKVLPGRTDNSIKNHWNSSLKKKLDFYRATGELPPVAKNCVQNGAKDMKTPKTKKLLIYSNKGSDSTIETSSGTTDICKLEEDSKDQTESTPLQDTCVSSSLIPHGSFDSEHGEFKERSSNIDHNCSNAESIQKFVTYGHNNRIDEDRDIGTPLQFEAPPYGSLYYEPPHIGSLIQLDSNPSSMYRGQYEYNSNPSSIMLPFRLFAGLSRPQSPESIIKTAAKMAAILAAEDFPGTPSILQKRTCVSQKDMPSRKTRKVDGEIVNNRFSDEPERTRSIGEKSESDGKLCSIPTSYGNSTTCPNGKAYNVSPPYRLRSKRTAVCKSVEKQLDFTNDMETRDSSTKSVELSVQRSCPVVEGSHATKMGVT